MGDHFVLLVDRLLTESTLEAAIASRNQLLADNDTKIDVSPKNLEFEGKIVECRICQDEDADSNMETPCSCSGSLKYAHRRCIQRWCNEKGNTMCEICHQQFKPGYTAPPPLFQIGRLPMNFRGSWETSRQDLNGPRFIAVVSTDHNFVNPDFEEEYSTSPRNLISFRTLLIAFMVLLVVRHTLPVILTSANDISFPLLMLLFLRTAGIVLPIYAIVRVVTAIQRRRFQQEAPNLSDEVDLEAEHSTVQAQPPTVNVN